MFIWRGIEEAEKVKKFHIAYTVVDYGMFRENLVSLLQQLLFKGAYRATFRNLKQASVKYIFRFAAGTTDLYTRADSNFLTDNQISLAVDNFMSSVVDLSSREYMQRNGAHRTIE